MPYGWHAKWGPEGGQASLALKAGRPATPREKIGDSQRAPCGRARACGAARDVLAEGTRWYAATNLLHFPVLVTVLFGLGAQGVIDLLEAADHVEEDDAPGGAGRRRTPRGGHQPSCPKLDPVEHEAVALFDGLKDQGK